MTAEEYARVAEQGRDELVMRHAPLVKRIACHMMARLPAHVALDDLVQAGMLGLLDAARRYTAGRGASFETYAGIRIRGAILDELRRNDWLPRSVHRRTREVARTVREIEARDGRAARAEDVAAALGLNADEYGELLVEIASAKMFSLEELRGERNELPEETDDESAPGAEIERAELRAALARQVDGLPEREKLVLSLYYERELNLREIGEVLGVTESRVCQIHAQALVRLRARLAEWRGDDGDG
ncbi:MAG: RNA polymerase sigma factor FliA [Steroidobacteraceae bacterium]